MFRCPKISSNLCFCIPVASRDKQAHPNPPVSTLLLVVSSLTCRWAALCWFPLACPNQKRSCRDMSEWITSDTGIQPCDPNSNSVATAEASSTSIFKNRPLRGGWDGWVGGRGKAREFRRVGPVALVGGDGLVVVSFHQCVFPHSSYRGKSPLEKRPTRGRCEIRWEVSQWTCYTSGLLLIDLVCGLE